MTTNTLKECVNYTSTMTEEEGKKGVGTVQGEEGEKDVADVAGAIYVGGKGKGEDCLHAGGSRGRGNDWCCVGRR